MTVVSAARAKRLARRAHQRRPDGSRGWLARRAWRTLTGAAERGDAHAIEALVQAWQRDPVDDVWSVVSRWLTTVDIVAAAVRNATDAAARDAIGAFCARHGLVPEDAVDRAMFYVLTGQQEQHQALDPDGSLLTRGYRGADDATRRAVRLSMVGRGGLSLLRVIADRPDRVLTAAEAAYLAPRLATAGEWDQLWRLIPTIPLVSAIRAAHLFQDWRPADDPGRVFLDRLAGMAPDAVAALEPAAVTWLDAADSGTLSFAPDNSELAVWQHRSRENDLSSRTTIFALPSGSSVASYVDTGLDMLAFGDATIVHHGSYEDGWKISRCSPGQPSQMLLWNATDYILARTRGGFVAVSPWDIAFGTPEGQVVHSYHLPFANSRTMRLLAADPTSGRLAIRESGKLHLLDADLQVLAAAPAEEFVRGRFCTPGRLITDRSGDHVLVSWRYDGTNLVREAQTPFRTNGTVIPVPGHDLVLSHRPGERLWLDASTLAKVGPPPEFPPLDEWYVVFSLDGSLVAAHSHTEVEVRDLRVHRLAALTGRSLTELDRSVLETVDTPCDHPAVIAVLGLIRAGVDYRFGADISLGSGNRAAARGDDIALGGDG